MTEKIKRIIDSYEENSKSMMDYLNQDYGEEKNLKKSFCKGVLSKKVLEHVLKQVTKIADDEEYKKALRQKIKDLIGPEEERSETINKFLNKKSINDPKKTLLYGIDHEDFPVDLLNEILKALTGIKEKENIKADYCS